MSSFAYLLSRATRHPAGNGATTSTRLQNFRQFAKLRAYLNPPSVSIIFARRKPLVLKKDLPIRVAVWMDTSEMDSSVVRQTAPPGRSNMAKLVFWVSKNASASKIAKYA